MSSDANMQLALRPEHLQTLEAFGGGRVISACICRDGRSDPEGFALYGRLEFLANCGLVEFLARDGRRKTAPGTVSIYYYLTDRGRGLLHWRVGSAATEAAATPAHRREATAGAPCTA
jgi:hypothetical protein